MENNNLVSGNCGTYWRPFDECLRTVSQRVRRMSTERFADTCCFTVIQPEHILLPQPLRMKTPQLVATLLSGTLLSAVGNNAFFDFVISFV